MTMEFILLLVCHCRVKLMHELVDLCQFPVTVTKDKSLQSVLIGIVPYRQM